MKVRQSELVLCDFKFADDHFTITIFGYDFGLLSLAGPCLHKPDKFILHSMGLHDQVVIRNTYCQWNTYCQCLCLASPGYYGRDSAGQEVYFLGLLASQTSDSKSRACPLKTQNRLEALNLNIQYSDSDHRQDHQVTSTNRLLRSAYPVEHQQDLSCKSATLSFDARDHQSSGVILIHFQSSPPRTRTCPPPRQSPSHH